MLIKVPERSDGLEGLNKFQDARAPMPS